MVGYHGDNKESGQNQPLICTVTLHDFKPEDVYKRKSISTVPALKKVITDSTPQFTYYNKKQSQPNKTKTL
jgi:hypothetical protein